MFLNRSALSYALSLVAAVNSAAVPYRVQKGDTLSQIAAAQIGYPVWSQKGSLEIIHLLNPEIQNLNRIYAGQVIKLESPSPALTHSAQTSFAREPAAETAGRIESGFQRRSSFILQPSFQVSNIHSSDLTTGVSSTLASDISFAAEGRYQQHWSESFRTFVGAKLSYLSFAKPTSATKSIVDSKIWRSGFLFGIDTDLSSALGLETAVVYQNEIFIRALNTSLITFDSIYVPSFNVKLKWDLVHLNPFTFGAAATAAFSMPVDTDGYRVQSGYQYGAALYLKEMNETGASSMAAEVGFGVRDQNTSIATQKETTLFLKFHFFFEKTKGGQ